MAGTKKGGEKAAQTNKKRYGDDFYKKMGKLGGMKKTTKPKGFAYLQSIGEIDKIREAGRKGGAKPRIQEATE